MKTTNHVLKVMAILLICLPLLTNCTTAPDKKAPPSQPTTLVGSPPPPVITKEFASFLKGFPIKSGATVYDADWLQQFASGTEIREISPKQCERYIYDKQIIAEDHGHRSLSKEEAYYYVGRLPDNGQYIAIVFTDLSDGEVSTYLCTYQRDGKFISGIVLQCLHTLVPEINNISHKIEILKNTEKSIYIKPVSTAIAKGYQIDSTGSIERMNAQVSG